jgi:hypothetical protein
MPISLSEPVRRRGPDAAAAPAHRSVATSRGQCSSPAGHGLLPRSALPVHASTPQYPVRSSRCRLALALPTATKGYPSTERLVCCVRDSFRCSVRGASASDVVRIGGLSRASAQASASPQRYKGRQPNLRNGGPPPLVAFVAKVFAFTGNPASVSAAATISRVSS